MTDEEVIEKLRAIHKQFDVDDETFYAISRAMVLVHRSIWIPVTDGLPSVDGTYLVTTENDMGTRRLQVSSFTRIEDIGYSWGIETSPIYKVVAWMNAPEMWEE